MRKFIIALTVLAVIAFAVPVFAGAVAGFDNSDTDVALGSGGRVVVTDLAFDATNATDDVTIYISNGDCTEFSADEAAAQTLLSTVYESAIATDAVLLIYRADGSYGEIKTASANSTAGVITVGAIDFAYKDGDKLCEAQTLFTWSNVGTDAVALSSDNGLFSVRGPVGFTISAGTASYIAGFTE